MQQHFTKWWKPVLFYAHGVTFTHRHTGCMFKLFSWRFLWKQQLWPLAYHCATILCTISQKQRFPRTVGWHDHVYHRCQLSPIYGINTAKILLYIDACTYAYRLAVYTLTEIMHKLWYMYMHFKVHRETTGWYKCEAYQYSPSNQPSTDSKVDKGKKVLER